MPGVRSSRGSWTASSGGWQSSRPVTDPCWRATRATRSRPAASACARCSCAWPRAHRHPRPTVWCAPPSRSSSCTGRRSSTTTCSTGPRSDAAARRWSRPEGETSRSRPATCCSRERSPSSPAAAPADAVRILTRASRELALGELAQREDAFKADVTVERYLARCRLKTAVLVPCGLRAGCARGRGRARAARRVRRADRARVPDPRRRPRRHRPAGAHRQAPGGRPARRHGQSPADPRPRAGSRARRARPSRRAHGRRRARGVRADHCHGRPRERQGARRAADRRCQAHAAGAARASASGARTRGRRDGRPLRLRPRSPRAGPGRRAGR